MTFAIVPFRAEHADAWYGLNRAWLDAHGLYEPPDEAQLADPFGAVIAPGGVIFVALMGDVVVGTAAMLPHGHDEWELAKLTVADGARRLGLGRRLAETCIAHARQLGVPRVVLVSSTRLGVALRLYESMGFIRRPVPCSVPYVTADVYMVMELGPATA